MKEIDILITSTSRVDCLEKMINSLKEKVGFSGRFNFHIHEGPTNWEGFGKKAIKETERYIKKSGVFSSYQFTVPNINKADALMKLKKHAKSKYLFYCEDDGEFTDDVNLDKLLDIMEDNNQINQITFNHPTLVHEINKKLPKPNKTLGHRFFHYRPRIIDGTEFVIAERWHGCQAIGRRSFIMPRWEFKGGRCSKQFNGRLKKECSLSNGKEWDDQWLEKNIGSFILLKQKINHIAGDRRTERGLL